MWFSREADRNGELHVPDESHEGSPSGSSDYMSNVLEQGISLITSTVSPAKRSQPIDAGNRQTVVTARQNSSLPENIVHTLDVQWYKSERTEALAVYLWRQIFWKSFLHPSISSKVYPNRRNCFGQFPSEHNEKIGISDEANRCSKCRHFHLLRNSRLEKPPKRQQTGQHTYTLHHTQLKLSKVEIARKNVCFVKRLKYCLQSFRLLLSIRCVTTTIYCCAEDIQGETEEQMVPITVKKAFPKHQKQPKHTQLGSTGERNRKLITPLPGVGFTLCFSKRDSECTGYLSVHKYRYEYHISISDPDLHAVECFRPRSEDLVRIFCFIDREMLFEIRHSNENINHKSVRVRFSYTVSLFNKQYKIRRRLETKYEVLE
ncbi:hypothetical protein CLF_112692 [Clonorchis sinensis]|uniref:Uncharacterized protein n=1 Tax=Clonorchis sinensis TaxID=79923 RepID=G7YWT6_CLOSI|nr:hypothetical protein CLF_112692 [Clonorchis sinensis]